jgi:hypothetical protein
MMCKRLAMVIKTQYAHKKPSSQLGQNRHGRQDQGFGGSSGCYRKSTNQTFQHLVFYSKVARNDSLRQGTCALARGEATTMTSWRNGSGQAGACHSTLLPL